MSIPEYQAEVENQFRQIKSGAGEHFSPLPIMLDGCQVGRLEAVTWADLNNAESIALLGKWREAASHAFPAIFPVTQEGTQRWLHKGVLETSDRLLFWLVTNAGEKIGHLGLFRFDYVRRTVEVDNIVRGVTNALPGIMQSAVQALMDWTTQQFQVSEIRLQVFGDNERAIRLYQRLGFQECGRTPLAKEVEGVVTRWVDAAPGAPYDRQYVAMRLPVRAGQNSLPQAA